MENINESLKELLQVSPPLALLLFLNLVFTFVKRSSRIPSDIIPWIAPVLGGVLYPLLTDPANVAFAVRSPLAAQIITGCLVGGAAVGANQWLKTFYKKVGINFDTEAITQIEKARDLVEAKAEKDIQASAKIDEVLEKASDKLKNEKENV